LIEATAGLAATIGKLGLSHTSLYAVYTFNFKHTETEGGTGKHFFLSKINYKEVEKKRK
jgi:hypothetical protein